MWGERASRAQYSSATLYGFLYWFWEKNLLFCSLNINFEKTLIAILKSLPGEALRNNKTIPGSVAFKLDIESPSMSSIL